MKKIFKDNPRPIRAFMTNHALSITIMFIVIVMASFILFYGPNIGLSDNGDYPRFAKSNFIYSLEDSKYPFYYFYEQYRMDVTEGSFFNTLKGSFETNKEGGNPYYSPHFIFIQLSKILNFIANKLTDNALTHYNINKLASLYIFLYAISLGLILQYLKDRNIFQKIFASLLLLIVFCDQGYLLYFNSFYGEPAQLVLSMLTIGLALQIMSKKGGRLLIICYFGCVFLLAGSKFTNIPIGILFGMIGLLFIGLNEDKLFKWITLTSFIGAAIGIYLLSQTIPKWMDDVTNYQAVFFGVLKNSETPEEDLQYLGIDKKYVILKNTHGYMGSNYPINIYTDAFREDFYAKVSKVQLLKFYLSHPKRFIEKLDVSAKNSGYISPPYLGHYGVDKPRFEFAKRFDFWGSLRLFLQFDRLWMIIVYLTAALAVLIIETIRWRKYSKKNLEHLILLILWLSIIASTAIHFVIPIIGNGEADLAKHMFGFIHYFDLMVIIIWFWLFNECAKNKRILKLTIGVLLFTVTVIAYANIYQKPYKQLDIGAYVVYGHYQNKPMIWQVIHTDDQSILLFSKEVITKMPYDKIDDSSNDQRQIFGSNLWTSSDIRSWLNGPFIEETGVEPSHILDTEHINYLSIEDEALKEKGSHPLYWTFVPSVVDWNDEEAYNNKIKDKIFLLDGSEVYFYLSLNGLAINKEEPYWLRTPMASSPSMVRYVGTDGYVLHKDAVNTEIGIAPALRLNKNIERIKGEGTLKHPFVIN